MLINKLIRQFLLPKILISFLYWHKYGCIISPKSEIVYEPNKIVIGHKTRISSFCQIKVSEQGKLKIGNNVAISMGSCIAANKAGIEIGDYCMIGTNVSIIDGKYIYDKLDIPLMYQGTSSRGIRIGEDVWIGSGSIILDGVTIGSKSIITPNSVVSYSIPERSICQGNPAKVIFERR